MVDLDPVESATSDYLRSPLEAVPSGVPSSTSLGTAFEALLAGALPSAARAEASAVLERNPEVLGAYLLIAQADFVEGKIGSARERLAPWILDHLGYFPAVLLWARLSELGGDEVGAFEAYREVADRAEVAASGRDRVQEEAVRKVTVDLRLAAEQRRLSEAQLQARRLELWAPGSQGALEGRWRVSQAAGDPSAELETLREVLSSGYADPSAVERRAELELTRGDAQTALRLFEDLVAADPRDRAKTDNLARARFRWRLQVLPEDVVGLTEAAQLSRADFAALLYWLVPGVRGGSSSSGRIATDILDVASQRRREIARVVNRDLMQVDPTQHRFHPERSLTRSEALSSLLSVLSHGSERPACISRAPAVESLAPSEICAYSARCGLLDETGDCLAAAQVSGRDAQELLRRSLAVLGGE